MREYFLFPSPPAKGERQGEGERAGGGADKGGTKMKRYRKFSTIALALIAGAHAYIAARLVSGLGLSGSASRAAWTL